MEEQSFLNESSVTVTKSRFIVPSQTYAMSGVTSVKTYEETPSRKGPILLVLLGMLALTGGLNTIVMALLLLAGGIVWFMKQKSTYHILLSIASGEVKALSHHDGNWIGRVVSALNQAIVARG